MCRLKFAFLLDSFNNNGSKLIQLYHCRYKESKFVRLIFKKKCVPIKI